MDLKTQSAALSLAAQIFDSKNSTTPKLSTPPQKPPFPGGTIEQPFPRRTPEEAGLSSDHVAGFLDALRRDDTLDMHNILILRGGTVVAEAGFGAYDPAVWHITHSECKTITGMAIGMLIDEGRLSLDDKVLSIFEKRAGALAHIFQRSVTVRHLLTMTSGVTFNEAGSVTESDWVRCFLESVLRFEPGTKFAYNSMNTYMLSAIVRQITGQGLTEYLTPRLFEPLGITDFFWEKCPQGIEKGGWGLYIRPEDIAKLGQLLLQKGRWNGRQLLSEHWVAESTSVKAITPPELGGYNYAYQMWVGRQQKCFLMNGMFGQNVIGFPDTGVLIVSNAGNNELFQQSSFFTALDRFFGPDFHPADAPLPPNPAAYARLQQTLRLIRLGGTRAAEGAEKPGLRQRLGRWLLREEDFSAASRRRLAGRRFVFSDKSAPSVGLLPLYTQAVQNNYTRGLQALRFSEEDGVFVLTVEETDETYVLPIGFDQPLRTQLSFHGEPYLAACMGRFFLDEDGHTVLRVRISFLESAGARMLRLSFSGDEVTARWDEIPGEAYLLLGLESLLKTAEQLPLGELLLGKYEPDYLLYRIHRALSPVLRGREER